MVQSPGSLLLQIYRRAQVEICTFFLINTFACGDSGSQSGEDCYAVCTACEMAVHQPFAKKGKYCFFDLHNDARFGLCCCDVNKVGKRKCDWTPPTNKKKNIECKTHCAT